MKQQIFDKSAKFVEYHNLFLNLSPSLLKAMSYPYVIYEQCAFIVHLSPYASKSQTSCTATYNVQFGNSRAMSWAVFLLYWNSARISLWDVSIFSSIWWFYSILFFTCSAFFLNSHSVFYISKYCWLHLRIFSWSEWGQYKSLIIFLWHSHSLIQLM